MQCCSCIQTSVDESCDIVAKSVWIGLSPEGPEDAAGIFAHEGDVPQPRYGADLCPPSGADSLETSQPSQGSRESRAFLPALTPAAVVQEDAIGAYPLQCCQESRNLP